MRLGIFALALLSLVLACGNSTSRIVGEWESQGSFRGWGERLEFSKDGSFESYNADGLDIGGTYSFPEDGVIKFQAGGLIARHKFSVKGDRLTFQDSRVGTVEYVRVKKR